MVIQAKDCIQLLDKNSNSTYIFISSHQRGGMVRRCSFLQSLHFFSIVSISFKNNIIFSHILRFLSLFCRFFNYFVYCSLFFWPLSPYFSNLWFQPRWICIIIFIKLWYKVPLHVKFRNAFQVKCSGIIRSICHLQCSIISLFTSYH